MNQTQFRDAAKARIDVDANDRADEMTAAVLFEAPAA